MECTRGGGGVSKIFFRSKIIRSGPLIDNLMKSMSIEHFYRIDLQN